MVFRQCIVLFQHNAAPKLAQAGAGPRVQIRELEHFALDVFLHIKIQVICTVVRAGAGGVG